MNYNGFSLHTYKDFMEQLDKAVTVDQLREVMRRLIQHIYYNTNEDDM